MEFTGYIEIIATVFGLVCVWLTVKENIWCWPTGLVMVVLYIYIFYKARLYSDMSLQVIYVPLQFYGWYNWQHGGRDRGELQVARITVNTAFFWLAVAAVGTAGVGYVFDTRTNADLPYWDATTTVLSLIAQYLMAKKILESWVIWIIVDVLSVGIYMYKGLYPTTGLYMIFLGLATMGFFEWRKSFREPVPA